MPQSPKQMRASDADRQRIADVLAEAFADGRLTIAEHSERTDAVWAAKTVGDLEPLIADLSPTGLPGGVAGPATRAVVPLGRPLQSVHVFSSGEQTGDWLVPAQINAFSLFGGSKFDMREAAFSSLDVTLQVNVIFGDVDVFVPAGVTVIDETVKLFGSVDLKGLGTPDPNAPVIRIRGFVLFGDVDVRGAAYRTFGQRIGLSR